MSVVVENLLNDEDQATHPRYVKETYVQSVTKPFELMATLFILSKYKLRDGVITSNSFLYNVVSGIWSLALILVFFFSIFHIYFFTTGLEDYNFKKHFTKTLIFFMYLMGNMTSYCTNVMQRNNNVLLALKIQNICAVFKANGKSLKKYSLLNWLYLVALVLFHFVWTIVFYIGFSSVGCIGEAITSKFYVIIDSNLLYSIRLIKLILEPLKIWVADAQKSIIVFNSENELYWNRKFRLYMEIVEAYEIVAKNYQLLILCYYTDIFINGVISLFIHIELAKTMEGDFIKIAASSLAMLWMVKNISLIISLCLEYESFYTVLMEVQSTCIQLTNTKRCSEFQKRACKNIQRVHAASFKKMSACGLFVIDAALPLRLFGLLTTYSIVILQYEFL